MKLIIILFIAKAGLSFVNETDSAQSSILGIWKAAELENSTIEVYQGNDGYIYGKIIESDQKDWIDEVILKKVKYDAAKKTWEGFVYSLRMYFNVDVVMTLESEKKLKIVGTKWYMSKTFYWTR